MENIFRKFSVAFWIGMSLAGNVYPQVIALEQFDYAESNVFGMDGGTGWDGGWYKANGLGVPDNGGSDDAAGGLLSGSLVNSAYPFAAKGNRVGVDLDGPRPARLLAMPLSMDVDADYYFSFMMSSGHNVTGNELQFMGVDSLLAGFREGSVLNARVVGDGGTQAKLGGFAIDTPYFLVGKISARASGDDVIYMNVYAEGDTVPLVEGAWDLASGGAALTGNIIGVMLQHNANNPDGKIADGNPTEYDELRIGMSYGSVVMPSAGMLGLFVLGAGS